MSRTGANKSQDLLSAGSRADGVIPSGSSGLGAGSAKASRWAFWLLQPTARPEGPILPSAALSRPLTDPHTGEANAFPPITC